MKMYMCGERLIKDWERENIDPAVDSMGEVGPSHADYTQYKKATVLNKGA